MNYFNFSGIDLEVETAEIFKYILFFSVKKHS